MKTALHILAALAIAGLMPGMGAFHAAHAIEIAGRAPRLNVRVEMPAEFRAEIETRVNARLAATFEQLLEDAREDLRGMDRQRSLAKGFANANAFSAHSAGLQAFPSYDRIAVATGFLVGMQAPSADPSYYARIRDEISDRGDIYAGVGVGASFLNVGFNAGFLFPGLYLNAKYGAMQEDYGDFDFNSSVVGGGFRILLAESRSDAGIARWKGISAGSGVYYQASLIATRIEGESIERSFPIRDEILGLAPEAEREEYAATLDEIGFTAENPDASMSMTPTFDLDADVSTMTIPFDVNTAVSLFWDVINFHIGAGIDLNSGSSQVAIHGLADAATASPDPARFGFTDAEVTLDGEGENGPTYVSLRFMTGIGLGLGPLRLDAPLIYYPSSGMAFGLTAAVVL